MSKFDELLATLQGEATQQGELAKSLPAVDTAKTDEDEDDETIAAAAAASGAADGGDGAAPAAPAADAGKEESFGKSFEFTDAAGETQQAVDATELVKSLMGRLEATEGALSATDTALTKALGSFTSVIKSQGEMIKSLSAQVQTLSSQGRGRKTMVAISEKPALGDLTQSQQADDGMSTQEFFAKANTAFEAGKITGKDLNVISVSLRMNEAHSLDKSLVTKVLTA